MSWVTPFLLLVVVGAGYGGYKYIPVYWQAQKVDEALSSVKWEASKINLIDSDKRENGILERLRLKVLELGVDERYLYVYFGDDYRSVHADYNVWVDHPFGRGHFVEMTRQVDVPERQ